MCDAPWVHASSVDVAVRCKDLVYGLIVHLHKHDPIVLASHQDFLDRPELNTTPIFRLVVTAEEYNDEVRSTSAICIGSSVTGLR
jgi:hypothetical protein